MLSETGPLFRKVFLIFSAGGKGGYTPGDLQPSSVPHINVPISTFIFFTPFSREKEEGVKITHRKLALSWGWAH